jgi:hypothetical protein
MPNSADHAGSPLHRIGEAVVQPVAGASGPAMMGQRGWLSRSVKPLHVRQTPGMSPGMSRRSMRRRWPPSRTPKPRLTSGPPPPSSSPIAHSHSSPMPESGRTASSGIWRSRSPPWIRPVPGPRHPRPPPRPRRLIFAVEAQGMVPQIERIAAPYGIAVHSSGGFDSTTAKYQLAERLGEYDAVEVLHLGDHDPSGVHPFLSMVDDVETLALDLGLDVDIKFTRLAVTPRQVTALGLPTALPKVTDRRKFEGATVRLEAIPPDVLAALSERPSRSGSIATPTGRCWRSRRRPDKGCRGGSDRCCETPGRARHERPDRAQLRIGALRPFRTALRSPHPRADGSPRPTARGAGRAWS